MSLKLSLGKRLAPESGLDGLEALTSKLITLKVCSIYVAYIFYTLYQSNLILTLDDHQTGVTFCIYTCAKLISV